MIEKPWNTICPSCKNKHAYKGFMICECPNYECKYHTIDQEQMVNQYFVDIEEDEKNLLETIPQAIDSEGFYTSTSYQNSNSKSTVPCGPPNMNNNVNNKTDVDDTNNIANMYGYGAGYYTDDNDSCSDQDINDLFGLA